MSDLSRRELLTCAGLFDWQTILVGSVTELFSWPLSIDSWPLRAMARIRRRRQSLAAIIDGPGKRGRDGAEFGFQAGVVRSGIAGVQQFPCACPLGPGLPEAGRHDGLDRSRGEEVLAGGDLDPDVDGGELAFSVPEIGLLGAGGRRAVMVAQVSSSMCQACSACRRAW